MWSMDELRFVKLEVERVVECHRHTLIKVTSASQVTLCRYVNIKNIGYP